MDQEFHPAILALRPAILELRSARPPVSMGPDRNSRLGNPQEEVGLEALAKQDRQLSQMGPSSEVLHRGEGLEETARRPPRRSALVCS